LVGGLTTRNDVSAAVGVFPLGWTFFTAHVTVPSFRGGGAAAAVFVLLTVTFVVLTIEGFQNQANLSKWGGYVGIAIGAGAGYARFPAW
jgi:succinate-acetate transporter protein